LDFSGDAMQRACPVSKFFRMKRRLRSAFSPPAARLRGKWFCAAENEVSSAKHNLLFAGANKILLRQDWALALLTFMSALLTLRPGLAASVMDMYSDFRIAINIILKYAAKVEGIFRPFIIRPKQLEDTTGATRRHLPKTWKIPHFLYLILQEN
jgi:hypothetical protein